MRHNWTSWAIMAVVLCVLAFAAVTRYHLGPALVVSSTSDTCLLHQGGDYCSTIKNQCDNRYFIIAKAYFCSSRTPAILISLSALVFAGLSILLTSLSVLVTNFLFKNLHELTEILHVPNKVLGFVLVPVTNALPDLINYYVILDSGANDLVLGQIVGSVLIMLTIIIGIICIMNGPFHVEDRRGLLVDLSWVLFTLVVFLVILHDAKITLLESMVMMGSYILYLISLSTFSSKSGDDCDTICDDDDDLLRLPSPVLSPSKSPVGSIRNIELVEEVIEESTGVFKTVLNTIELVYLFLVPITSIPENHSWWFHSYHANHHTFFVVWFSIEIPLFFNYKFTGWSLYDILPAAVLNVLLVLIFRKIASSTLKTLCINIIGIVKSTILLSMISELSLFLLKNLGLMWRVKDYLLGLFVFSVSNCINDIVTNVTLASKFSPIMGINACLGTPLLLILFGLGINSAAMILRNRNMPLEVVVAADATTSIIGLLLVVTLYAIYLPFNNWVLNGRIGLVAVFFFIAISMVNLFLKDIS